MGVEPFLISSTLMAVLGQRLVRDELQKLPHAVRADRKQFADARPFAARSWATKRSTTAAAVRLATTPVTKAAKGFSNCSSSATPSATSLIERATIVGAATRG
jgi:type II secretory ATPase GspE/PulE/Tfp pilus assembly ATPase PilB-like protein